MPKARAKSEGDHWPVMPGNKCGQNHVRDDGEGTHISSIEFAWSLLERRPDNSLQICAFLMCTGHIPQTPQDIGLSLEVLVLEICNRLITAVRANQSIPSSSFFPRYDACCIMGRCLTYPAPPSLPPQPRPRKTSYFLWYPLHHLLSL